MELRSDRSIVFAVLVLLVLLMFVGPMLGRGVTGSCSYWPGA